ncbi:unnamed protein product [Lymnaea stagnalis]|uniref:Uncharacterized protein n=1 Tax=Lymnaea stagnalis TaxID=6523 RepID=A0AAV2H3F8_LYMST
MRPKQLFWIVKILAISFLMFMALVFVYTKLYKVRMDVQERSMRSRQEDTDLPRQEELLSKLYYEKFADLAENHLLSKYPVHTACKDEKRPAVPCYDTECGTSLTHDLKLSIGSLLSVTRKSRTAFSNPHKDITAQLESSHLAIITGASANHFAESQGLIQSLHKNVFPKFNNISLYYYDFGLDKGQLEQLMRHCRCKVLKFPVHLLPTNATRNIKCFAWKVLIIEAHLTKTDMLIYADTSVRFNSTKNEDLFTDLANKGLLLSLSDRYVRPVAHNTAPSMFKYFNIQPCSVANFQELEAGFVALLNQPFTRQVLVQTWAACAMDPNCMCPEGSHDLQHCDGGLRKYAKCHRFDQSALTLITLQLFQDYYSSFFFDHSYYSVLRGDRPKYFEALNKAV